MALPKNVRLKTEEMRDGALQVDPEAAKSQANGGCRMLRVGYWICMPLITVNCTDKR